MTKQHTSKLRRATQVIFLTSLILFFGIMIGFLVFENTQFNYYHTSYFSGKKLAFRYNPNIPWQPPEKGVAGFNYWFRFFYLLHLFVVYVFGGTYFRSSNSIAGKINHIGDANSWYLIGTIGGAALLAVVVIMFSLCLKRAYRGKLFASVFSTFVFLLMLGGFSWMVYYSTKRNVWLPAGAPGDHALMFNQVKWMFIAPGVLLSTSFIGLILFWAHTVQVRYSNLKEAIEKQSQVANNNGQASKIEDPNLNSRISEMNSRISEMNNRVNNNEMNSRISEMNSRVKKMEKTNDHDQS